MRGVFLHFCLLTLLFGADARRKSSSSSSSSKGSSSSSSSSSSGSSSSSSSGTDPSAAEGRRKELIAKFAHIPVVPLSDRNYTNFIMGKPRDYWALLVFTALDPKYQCQICSMIQGTFNDVATYYQGQHSFANAPIHERLAFFVVDVEVAQDIFQSMELQTAPRLYLLPPREGHESGRLKVSDYELDMRFAYEGAAALMDEIATRTKIKIIKTMNPRPLLVGLAVVAVLLSLLVSAAATDLTNAWLWYQSRYLWVIVSVVCFSVGVSGSIFCIIRSSPMYGWEGGGRRGGEQSIRIFAGQGRDQYLVEGFIVAAWTVGCGLAGLIMFYSTKLPFALVRHAVALVGMSMFIVLGSLIFEAYSDKTQWYQIRETVPPPLWSFLTSSVKKNSGLLKRLVRLSEMWLFEYKDLLTFRTKAKLMVVDYVLRRVGLAH